MKTYQVIVIGMVERTITVEAENLESAKNTAEGEWSALTGGVIQTAETVSAVEIE